jgi:hypothetical protein
MAEVTLTAIQARIAALCTSISGIKTGLTDYPAEPFLSTALPAMVVKPGRVTYQIRATDTFIMSTEYGLILHVVGEGKDGIPDYTRESACYPFLMSVPKYFIGHPYLDGKTLPTDAPDSGIVAGSTFVNANGARRNIGYFGNGESAVYWGPVFRLVVRTLHHAP